MHWLMEMRIFSQQCEFHIKHALILPCEFNFTIATWWCTSLAIDNIITTLNKQVSCQAMAYDPRRVKPEEDLNDINSWQVNLAYIFISLAR